MHRDMTHEEIDRKYGPNGGDLDRDVLLHMHRTVQKFVEGNIVHVEGFTSRTSTGEVLETDANECCRTYTVHFDDGETTEFAENELRLANDQELFVYLQGHDVAFQRRVILQQPGTQLTAPMLPANIDDILEAVERLGMLEDYQMANLAEYLEDALRQKATRY